MNLNVKLKTCYSLNENLYLKKQQINHDYKPYLNLQIYMNN